LPDKRGITELAADPRALCSRATTNHGVTPAQAGDQNVVATPPGGFPHNALDSGFRRNDEIENFAVIDHEYKN
jgi:hypothetical protein